MKRRIASTCLAVLLLPGIATASAIDLRTLAGNVEQATWGRINTTIYAQSLIADDTFLTQVAFLARPINGPLVFSLLITGDRADGGGGGLGFAPDFADIRFDSGELTIPAGSPLTEITAFPNVVVVDGERLFIVLNTYTHPTSGNGAVLATPFQGPTDHYVPGEFVFLNTGVLGQPLESLNAFNFSRRLGDKPENQDLAIYANFQATPIPEPATVLLVGGGLAALARLRRRVRG